jgi:hypothetical protein
MHAKIIKYVERKNIRRSFHCYHREGKNVSLKEESILNPLQELSFSKLLQIIPGENYFSQGGCIPLSSARSSCIKDSH